MEDHKEFPSDLEPQGPWTIMRAIILLIMLVPALYTLGQEDEASRVISLIYSHSFMVRTSIFGYSFRKKDAKKYPLRIEKHNSIKFKPLRGIGSRWVSFTHLSSTK